MNEWINEWDDTVWQSSGVPVKTDSWFLLQTVNINLEDGIHDKHQNQQEQSYHFAVSGRAFAVIMEHFPQLVQKVSAQLGSHTATYLSTKQFVVFSVLLLADKMMTWCCHSMSLHMGSPQLVLRATVFARMAPDQKTQLVDVLQSIESVSPWFCGCDLSLFISLFLFSWALYDQMWFYSKCLTLFSFQLYCWDVRWWC